MPPQRGIIFLVSSTVVEKLSIPNNNVALLLRTKEKRND
jgi:hypothetical protein